LIDFNVLPSATVLVRHKLAFHIQLRRNGHLGSIAGHAKSAAKEHAKNPEGWADGFARG
jgi:hypothetical protein